jgi:hypothetical protein
MFFAPIIPGIFCTMTDCIGDGVHVDLIGQIPTSYTVEVDFPSGKRKITCPTNSVTGNSFSGDFCKSNGAFFEQIDSQAPSDLPPEELVVTVTFDGKQISRTFHPEYEVWHVNGKYCPPMCYFTTIEFDLSQ